MNPSVVLVALDGNALHCPLSMYLLSPEHVHPLVVHVNPLLQEQVVALPPVDVAPVPQDMQIPLFKYWDVEHDTDVFLVIPATL